MLHLDQWAADSVQRAADAFTLPELTTWQRQVLTTAVHYVGYPYVWGGGHSSFTGPYDCSGAVSAVLHAGGFLPAPEVSGQFESFGLPGPGKVTLYANPSHVFMYVAGLRWDTHDAAGAGDGGTGIGWHPLVRSSAGFLGRHPGGL